MKRERSKITWTHFTFNPWIGCTKVSPGCRLCYAEAQDHHWGYDSWGKGKPRRHTRPEYWRSPFAWDKEAAVLGKRLRVFCASLADWADEEVPDIWRDQLFDTIERTSNLDWLLLTKRMKPAIRYLQRRYDGHRIPDAIWVGGTACTRKELHDVVEDLVEVPAVVRWLSLEPLLEQVSLYESGAIFDVFNAKFRPGQDPIESLPVFKRRLEWVVVGGESGPIHTDHPAASFHPIWAMSLKSECEKANVAFFMKQFGSRPLDLQLPGKGDNMALFPEDLRVQQFPNESPFRVDNVTL